MEGYQDTDLGIIPKDWKITELSDIAKCSVGIATSTTHAYSETGVLLLRNQNIKEGKIALNDVLYINSEFDELNKSKRLRENDIITVRTGYPGISAVVPKELEGAQSFTTLIIRLNEQKPLSNFLCYYINSEKGKTFFTNNQAGGGQQNVGAKTLERMKIPLPPLPEQQKIAEILSTLDAKIEVIDQQITETQALKKGLMQRLLTKGIGHTEFKDSPLGEIPKSWEVVELGSVLSKIVGGGTPSKENIDYWNGEIPWATVKDLKKTIIADTIDYITEEGLKNSSANLIPAWTLIIPTRMALGKAVFFEKAVSINQDLKALYTKEVLDKYYLSHWFFYNSDFILSLGSGSTVKGIRLEVLKGLKISLPSISEQKEIASILSTNDDKLEVLTEKKTHYQELKQGLMQQLLTGKIRVSINEKRHN
jgi:type I restriction enzyme S subunit